MLSLDLLTRVVNGLRGRAPERILLAKMPRRLPAQTGPWPTHVMLRCSLPIAAIRAQGCIFWSEAVVSKFKQTSVTCTYCH